jgi:pyrroline-5-carboxylate reductase
MRCGFIGYGNMGSAVVRALLGDGSLQERDVVVYNRTPGRLKDLGAEHPEVAVAASMAEVARSVEALFICVHSPAVPEVLSQVQGALSPAVHLITINGGIGIGDLEACHDGAVSKVIPSITIETGRGVTLIAHGRKVPAARAEALEALFSRSGMVKVLPENKLAVATDLTSCGPGLMAQMMAEFAFSGARAGGIDEQEALIMVTETMLGTALMLADGPLSPQELAGRVATKGGITEQGLKVLETELPVTFERMFDATGRKRAAVKAAMADRSEH